MIIYIDDEESQAKEISFFLKNNGYTDTVYVINVGDAKEKIEKNLDSIKLVITDIIMPPEGFFSFQNVLFGKNTGLIFSKWIREKHSSLPIWAVTKRDDLDDNEYKKYGISKLFVKPIDKNKLLNEINKLFR